MINLSWNDIRQYVKWLSTKTGMPYRLLTEAEWEYAARGITDASNPHPRYSWGEEVGENNANCADCKSQWDNKQTAPVGSFKPNAFGLYDMHGNVWEWVQDCHGDYAEAPNDGSAAPESDNNCSRVLRGGSWNNIPRILHAAYRSASGPDNRYDGVGFRVARVLSPGSTLEQPGPSGWPEPVRSRSPRACH